MVKPDPFDAVPSAELDDGSGALEARPRSVAKTRRKAAKKR